MAEHVDADTEEVSDPSQPESVMSEGTGSEAPEVEPRDVEDYDSAVDAVVDEDPKDVARQARTMSPVRLATLVGVVAILASTSVAGWLGYREHQARLAQQQTDLLIRVGRQGALNLTTIDWHHADSDIRRILDSATGAFHDDFSKRSQPFIEVLKKA
ncbi:MAG: Mce protein, partial [Mycobacterium sp.]|uniref:Mce protein n=1 Tax=Mycobacterium sp. TaxID=1785 RepID=UPI003C97C6E3